MSWSCGASWAWPVCQGLRHHRQPPTPVDPEVFQWGEDCAASFAQLRSALVEAPILAYPDPRQPFIVDTDASNVGLEAVLSQEGEHGEQ